MCLAVPGRVLRIDIENGLPMGLIDYEGARNTACLSYVPEVEVGQYVIVHAGFALQILNEQEAAESLQLLTRLNALIEADIEAGSEPASGEPQ